MAFTGAEKRIRRRVQAALSKGFMVRLGMVFLAAVSIASFHLLIKCTLPLLSFLRLEMLPHLRDAVGAWLTTQPFLFLVLNSMIVAILAPSGLFNDRCQCPNSNLAIEEEDPSSTLMPSTMPVVDVKPVDPVVVPSEPQENLTKNTLESEKDESPAPTQTKESHRRAASSDALPKIKVKKVKKMHKSQSLHELKRQHQMPSGSPRLITMGILPENDGSNRNIPTSPNAASSLKDDDFKELIDSFIARAHQQMITQELEFAAEARAARCSGHSQTLNRRN